MFARYSLIGLIALYSVLALAQSESTSESETLDNWHFNPLVVKRDPFKIPQGVEQGSMNELLRYDLTDMRLVAVLTGMGAPKAMVELPGGTHHILQMGDVVGPNRGNVSTITHNRVTVVSQYKDNYNKTQSIVSHLDLSE